MAVYFAKAERIQGKKQEFWLFKCDPVKYFKVYSIKAQNIALNMFIIVVVHTKNNYEVKNKGEINLKKIIIAILTAGIAVSIMSACSGGTDDTSSKNPDTSVNASSESKSESSKKTESQTPSGETSEKESSKPESSEDSKESSKTASSESSTNNSSDAKTVVVYKDINISIDDDASTILKKLGDPDFKETIQPEFSGESEAYSYTYDNMTIYANTKNGKQYVVNVTVSGPGEAKTANGIAVGASREQLYKAYGDAGKDDVVNYEFGKKIMIFTLQDDEVTDFSLDIDLGNEL